MPPTTQDPFNPHFQSLQSILSICTKNTPLPDRMNESLKFLGDTLAAEAVTIFEFPQPESDGPQLTGRFAWYRSKAEFENDPGMPQDKMIDGLSGHRQKPALGLSGESIPNPRLVPEEKGTLGGPAADPFVLRVPIQMKNRAWGIIECTDHRPDREWQPHQKQLLTAAASAIALALQATESDAQLKALVDSVDSSPLAVIITDGKGIIQHVNARFSALTGNSAQDSEGRGLSLLGSASDGNEQLDGLVRWLVHGNGRHAGTFVASRKDGSTFTSSFEAARLPPSPGLPGHFAIWLEDLTERSSAQRSAENTLRELQDQLGFKTTLLTLAAHEFLTPLAGILNASELLEDCYHRLTPEKRATYFSLIKREIRRLSVSVERLLVMGRLDAGETTASPQSVRIQDFCQKILAEIQLAYPKRPAVHLKHENVPAEMHLDRALLRHILGNLLDNASKYGDPDSPVELRLAQTHEGLSIEVEDKGLGIPAKELPTILAPFNRGSNVRHLKGTGIGLYVVRRCVEACSGRIQIESVEGKGTTIRILLPTQEAPPLQPSPANPSASDPGRHRNL